MTEKKISLGGKSMKVIKNSDIRLLRALQKCKDNRNYVNYYKKKR